MEESLDDKINRIKSELTVAKQANQLWDILLEKREILEEKISSLKDEIEDEHLKQYQEAHEIYHEAKRSENKREALDSIKKNKQSIDEKLDNYEDISGDIVTYLQNQLVITILKKYPDQEMSYHNLDRQLQKNINLADKLKVLISNTQNIDTLVQRIIEERAKTKPFRILQFFFGRNPNLAITQSIQAMKLLCGNSLDLLHDTIDLIKDNQRAKNCLEQLSEILVQLQTFSQQRWSYKKIDKGLLPLKDTINVYVKQLLTLKKEGREDIINQERIIENWIEQHSK